MAYIINCIDQVKHKTEKIKTIVKGAEKYLGMKETSWEDINRKLEGEKKLAGARLIVLQRNARRLVAIGQELTIFIIVWVGV